MSLREIAAMHRRGILAQPNGVGEPTVHIHGTTGIRTPGRGQWLQVSGDSRSPEGIGAEALIGRSYVVVADDFVPDMTRADQLERVTTGEVWTIDLITPTPGVGRKVILGQAGEALARGAR